MAEAGFYPVDDFSDRVLCFACRLGLRNWEVEDDPWVEHLTYCKQCPHAVDHASQLSKIKAGIKRLRVGGENEELRRRQPLRVETNQSRRMQHSAPENKLPYRPICITSRVSPTQQMLPTPSLQEPPTPPSELRRRQPFRAEPTPSQQEPTPSRLELDPTEHLVETFNKHLRQDLEAKQNGVEIMDRKDLETLYKNLLDENQTLTDSRKCCVCMTNYPDVVLEPCSHKCVCFKCYSSIWKNEGGNLKCPICRDVVVNYMKVFEVETN